MPVSQHESALSRGWLPSYLHRQVYYLLCLLMNQRARQGRTITRMSSLSTRLVCCFTMQNSQCSNSRLLSSLFNVIYHHIYSYDMNLRPTIIFPHLPLENPVEEFPAATFFQLTGFWPGQFEEICNNLILIPDIFVCTETQCRASKQLSIFLLLRRWNKADTWDDVSRVLHHGRVWCIKINCAVFQLLAQH
jgi:hypothetical protein